MILLSRTFHYNLARRFENLGSDRKTTEEGHDLQTTNAAGSFSFHYSRTRRHDADNKTQFTKTSSRIFTRRRNLCGTKYTESIIQPHFYLICRQYKDQSDIV